MPALDARRVKLTIFFPIDEPLSIDDALSGSSSRGGFVISSSAALGFGGLLVCQVQPRADGRG